MAGTEGLGDQVGVFELIAGHAARGLEADTEGVELALTGLASNPTIKLESRPPDSSTPIATSATMRRWTASSS